MRRYIKSTFAICALLGVGFFITNYKKKHKDQSSTKTSVRIESVSPISPNIEANYAKEFKSLNTDKATFYETPGREKIALDLDEKTVRERINNGFTTMTIVNTIVYPNEKISTLNDAYARLISSLPFMESRFPIWGIEDESYFVFSGRHGRKQEVAFKYGYAVKKDTGRISQWFYSED